MKGSYLLLVELPEEQAIPTGSLGSIRFPRGYYAYVGSAMGGLKPRLSRHFQGHKKPHWHIDYLLPEASISGAIVCETEERIECTIAQALSHRLDSIPGFGSSDCNCSSHLFFATNGDLLKSTIMAVISSMGIQPVSLPSVMPLSLL